MTTERLDLAFYAREVVNRTSGWVAGQVELTSDCHQKCVGCDSWIQHRKHGSSWSYSDLFELSKELEEMGLQHLSLTGGDPLAWEPLMRYLQDIWGFSIQVSTALARDLERDEMKTLRNRANRVRVSLDAATAETYQAIRRDGVNSPVGIVQRMLELAHPNLSVITTVFERNLFELPMIVRLLAEWDVQVEKVSFIPSLGKRGTPKTAEFIQRCKKQFKHVEHVADLCDIKVACVLDEEWIASKAAEDIRCWTGKASFHAKSDGWFYPCCLVGGEAIETLSDFRIGCYPELTARQIFAKAKHARCFYTPGSPCREICLVKQALFNRYAEEASRTRFALP